MTRAREVRRGAQIGAVRRPEQRFEVDRIAVRRHRKEREDPAAIVVQDHDRRANAVTARCQQATDVVQEGQVLARMDGREIRWKRAGVLADKSQAAKKRDSAMAAHEYAETQIARLEVDRLDLELRLLAHRAEHLEIKSPVWLSVCRNFRK